MVDIDDAPQQIAEKIRGGRTALGIEFGSTRIKAVLIDDTYRTIASGDYQWASHLEDGLWTYSLDEVWKGLQSAYASMANDVYNAYGERLTSIGHIEGSSLPVGSPHLNEEDFDDVEFPCHSLLSGHRGLPSARLFSDLNQMEIGDVFYLTVLDQTLTYQVIDTYVVLPTDSSKGALVEGMDLCTLITCTPYGINTHRLLVRGKRIPNEKKILDVRITADAVRIEAAYVAPFIAAPVLLMMVLWIMVITTGKRRY